MPPGGFSCCLIYGNGSDEVNSLFIVAPIVCRGLVLGPCVVLHFCAFLIKLSSHCGRKGRFHYFYSILGVTSLLLFFASSLVCCG